MKEKIRIFMLLLVLVGTMTAKSKKKSASRKAVRTTQQVVNATLASLIPGVANTTATSSPTMTDQQFLEEKLFGMQKNDLQLLKAKADNLKAKNAENKKIIDQGLSQLLSGPVIMYKNN